MQLSRCTHDPSLFGAYSHVCPTFVHGAACASPDGRAPSCADRQPPTSAIAKETAPAHRKDRTPAILLTRDAERPPRRFEPRAAHDGRAE